MLSLDERTVQELVEGLVKKHLVLEKSGFGSRVPKYQHRFCNTGFGSFEFTPVQTAIVCELLLRGPQTPGELRTRVPRMAELRDPAEVDSALEDLATRPDGPFVKQLPRESGRRDSRYAHLFSGEDGRFPSPPPKPRWQLNRSQRRVAAESRSSLQARVEHAGRAGRRPTTGVGRTTQ